ncbi:MAG: DUF362 domain-containing protein [Armatimonadetes bacterium]|nr:DUF362 domain-containing protein [Armatimonadota bacterium]
MNREVVVTQRCEPASSDERVIQATEEMLSGLDLAPHFRGKNKILVKTNAGVSRFTLTEGRQTELTDPPVLEAVIRTLRSLTDAEIVVGDAPTQENGWEVYEGLGLPERLKKYPNVRVVDFGHGPFRTARLTDSPLMFESYELHPDIVEADAVVSVSKMKAHRSLGCTLCMKNLFGLTPPAVYGFPRTYLHDHLIRLPRVIADLALLLKPALNVVDGIVAANHGEWDGTPMTPGVLVAGTNIVATDATAARVMGFDPSGDYPDHPFFYRNNAIKLVGNAGLGPIRAEEIEVRGPQPEEVCVPFEVERYGGTAEDRDRELQQGAQCVRQYRDRRSDYLDSGYENRILALRDDEILWDAPDVRAHQKKSKESGKDWKDGPQFVVRVLPEEREIERLDAYEPYECRLNEKAA